MTVSFSAMRRMAVHTATPLCRGQLQMATSSDSALLTKHLHMQAVDSAQLQRLNKERVQARQQHCLILMLHCFFNVLGGYDITLIAWPNYASHSIS